MDKNTYSLQNTKKTQNKQSIEGNEKINIAPYFTAQGYGPEQLKYIIHPINKHSHWLLNDIHKTIDIVKKAQNIMVIGDYDFDGISATTIMVKGLRTIGKNVFYLIPNRFKDGYGLNINLVKKTINEYNCDTIITVDNGIAAYEPVKFAKEQGLTVVVTDHHKLINYHLLMLLFILLWEITHLQILVDVKCPIKSSWHYLKRMGFYIKMMKCLN